MSASQTLIQKMSSMSLTDDNKTRHESKIRYRKDHMNPRPSQIVKQTSLPSPFSPTSFDYMWEERLTDSQSSVAETDPGDGKYNRSKVNPFKTSFFYLSLIFVYSQPARRVT